MYLPVESPSSDYYGGKRPGNNLYGESLVARRSEDRAAEVALPARPPSDLGSRHLVGADPDGRDDRRPHAQAGRAAQQADLPLCLRSRDGSADLADRGTPGAAGRRAGRVVCAYAADPEQARPRTAIPGLRIPDELIDYTPEMRAQAVENMKRYKWGGNFPYSGRAVQPAGRRQRQRPARRAEPRERERRHQLARRRCGSRDGDRLRAGEHVRVHARIGVASPARILRSSRIRRASSASHSVCAKRRAPAPMPTYRAASPVSRRRLRHAFRLRPPLRRAPAHGRGGQPARVFNAVEGLSMVKPPYGVLAAIDLARGELKWQVPHGDTPDVVRNHPKLKGITIPKTGQGGSVGVLVTKTLVIAGDPQVTTTPDHPRGAMMRAYDKQTGAEVGAVWMPAQVSGSPTTYRIGGRQLHRHRRQRRQLLWRVHRLRAAPVRRTRHRRRYPDKKLRCEDQKIRCDENIC